MPDDEQVGRADRGDVELGIVDADAPDRRCRTCRHSWTAGPPPPRRSVPAEFLSVAGHAAAVRLLEERTVVTRAVCEALLATGGDYDSDGPQAAHGEMVRWLWQHVELDPTAIALSGIDEIVVPEEFGALADVLDAAAAVCVSLELLWTGSVDQDRVTAEITAGLEQYRQRVSALSAPPDGLEWLEELFATGGDTDSGDTGSGDTDSGDADGWDEVSGIAGSVFDVWLSGSETRWARYAWASLRRGGLTTYATEVERARVVCRLLALSVLYGEFCARAFDEGRPGDWSFDESAVVGGYPLVDPFVLGQLAERDGVDADPDVGAEFPDGSPRTHAIRELTRAEYPAVAAVLLADLRATMVFASLWASDGSGVHYPLEDGAVHEAVNTDITGSKLVAWEWIDNGMPID